METSFALTALAFALAPIIVVADFIPEGSAAHFFSTQNTSLVFAPEGGFNSAGLVASLPGDGTFRDLTALFPIYGTGVPTQIVWGDWCVSARGVVPGTASQTLFIEDCSDDPAQIWTVNEDPMTVSNADGNCLTLGRAAVNVPITLAACTDVLQHLQLWNPKATVSI